MLSNVWYCYGAVQVPPRCRSLPFVLPRMRCRSRCRCRSAVLPQLVLWGAQMSPAWVDDDEPSSDGGWWYWWVKYWWMLLMLWVDQWHSLMMRWSVMSYLVVVVECCAQLSMLSNVMLSQLSSSYQCYQ